MHLCILPILTVSVWNQEFVSDWSFANRMFAMLVPKTSCCVLDLSDLSAVKDEELNSRGSSGQAC